MEPGRPHLDHNFWPIEAVHCHACDWGTVEDSALDSPTVPREEWDWSLEDANVLVHASITAKNKRSNYSKAWPSYS